MVVVTLAAALLVGIGLKYLTDNRIGVERIDVVPADVVAGGYKIDINAAGLSELALLPGIGKTRAGAIIKYRDENGYFSSTGELLNVYGIGDTILDEVEELITVGSMLSLEEGE